MTSWVLGAALVLLAGLLAAEKGGHALTKLMVKTPLSCLFVIFGLIQPRPDPGYYRLMLAGFLMCLLGDLLLVFQERRRLFLGGLSAFLCGHLFYTLALFSLGGGASPLWWMGCLLLAGVGVGVFTWLRSGLDGMRLPVAGYIVVISCMLAGAGRVVLDSSQPLAARGIIFFGALLFYLSDLLVACHRFIRAAYVNRLVGLPLYYSAQFLLAFSVGQVV